MPVLHAIALDTDSASEPRPINPGRAAKHFTATIIVPKSTVRATIGQIDITPDTWNGDLILRIKHRFGISTEAFNYRLKKQNLITKESTNTYIHKLNNHRLQAGGFKLAD